MDHLWDYLTLITVAAVVVLAINKSGNFAQASSPVFNFVQGNTKLLATGG